MFRAIQRAREEESGFTLIELLIVIVILGILAGVVIFSVGGVTDTGEVAACKTDLKTITVAVEAYKAKNGAFPPDLEPTMTDVGTATVSDQFLRLQDGLTGDTLDQTQSGYTITYYSPTTATATFPAGTVDSGGFC
jgi:prepilin-type N-terminal cleavage/methylation domain-containing protein